ncbi:MAG: LemA family protein [Methanomassiliicoccales archaeon]|nr:LemA family protein [Methanomassiliicoccales archaeon]
MAEFRPSKRLIVGIIAAVAVLIVVMMVILSYNGMVSKDQNVQSHWSDIEVAYQRKIDLIPTMYDVMNTSMEFEYNLMVNVTEARNKWQALSGNTEEKMNASIQLDTSFAAFVDAVNEAYPTLQLAPAVVLTFMDQFESTTNQIASERKFYNDAVKDYNSAIRSFPNVLFSGSFGFDEARYYERNTASIA